MLREIWQYLTTPAPAWARRAGLLHQSIAMEARYRRCRTGWDEHYAQCRATVVRAVHAVEPGGTLVVLGSGLLHDLPLELLESRFDRVLLVDAVHPRSARRRVQSSPRVAMVGHDLSGVLDPAGVTFDFPADTRLVVSLNLLSQLALPFADDSAVARQVIEAHLRLLQQAPARCLLSDIRWLTEDEGTGQGEATDPWHGAPHPDWDAIGRWSWTVAPPGEIAPGVRQVHEVSAWLSLG